MAQHDFTRWLSDALRGRPNTYLVERSGRKPNGRPRIDGSRVHAWLKGERPSFDLATVAAEALGRPTDEALRAAGYRVPPPAGESAPAQNGDRRGPDVADLLATDPTLSDASRAHIVAQYRLLQQLSRLEVPADDGQDVDEQAIRDSGSLNDGQKSEALEALWERRGRRRDEEQHHESGEHRDAR